MLDRRSILRTGGLSAFGAMALTTVQAGTDPQEAMAACRPLGDPATTREERPFPRDLTRRERRHLQTFDELDFVVYSEQQWHRFDESHSHDIRVHYADGSITDGLDAHIDVLRKQFAWAPDTHIDEHPVRVAKNGLTAVTGVTRGTFTRPMTMPDGSTVAPTGRGFAVNMATVGIWNRRHVMCEEFLFLDSATRNAQLGIT